MEEVNCSLLVNIFFCRKSYRSCCSFSSAGILRATSNTVDLLASSLSISALQRKLSDPEARIGRTGGGGGSFQSLPICMLVCPSVSLSVILLVSISPTFYEEVLRHNAFAKKITSPNCKHIKAVQKTYILKSCS
jgi:hypothetical protein